MIDFDRVGQHLARANYRKPLMLELYWRDRPQYAETDADTYYARAARVATRITEAVDQYRLKQHKEAFYSERTESQGNFEDPLAFCIHINKFFLLLRLNP